MSRATESMSPYSPPAMESELPISRDRGPLRVLSWRIGMWLALGELTIFLAIIGIQILEGTLLQSGWGELVVPVNFAQGGLDWIITHTDYWFPVMALVSFAMLAKTQFDLSRRNGHRAMIVITLIVATTTAVLRPGALFVSNLIATDPDAVRVFITDAYVLEDILSEALWNTVAFLFPIAAGGSLRLLEKVLARDLGVSAS